MRSNLGSLPRIFTYEYCAGVGKNLDSTEHVLFSLGPANLELLTSTILMTYSIAVLISFSIFFSSFITLSLNLRYSSFIS